MQSKTHIVLLGAGAIGVLPAVKLLQQENIRLTVAADSARVARYRKEGIWLNNDLIPFTFAAPEEMQSLPPADMVIAATKTPALAEALKNVEPLTDSRTIFLPLLNGITASDVIRKRFPGNIVLKGYFLGHASVRENNRIRHDGVGTFYLGGDPDAASAAADLLRSAGIEIDVPEDITSAMWKKFVLNIGVNQTQALFRADYGTMQQDPEMMEYARSLMTEAVAVARAEKVNHTENMVEDAMQVIREMPGSVKTSMLQDILAGRPTEVDAFAGTICELAAKHSIPVPCNAKVLAEISSAK